MIFELETREESLFFSHGKDGTVPGHGFRPEEKASLREWNEVKREAKDGGQRRMQIHSLEHMGVLSRLSLKQSLTLVRRLEVCLQFPRMDSCPLCLSWSELSFYHFQWKASRDAVQGIRTGHPALIGWGGVPRRKTSAGLDYCLPFLRRQRVAGSRLERWTLPSVCITSGAILDEFPSRTLWQRHPKGISAYILLNIEMSFWFMFLSLLLVLTSTLPLVLCLSLAHFNRV